jgi:holliday junction DNA helicase RuvA
MLQSCRAGHARVIGLLRGQLLATAADGTLVVDVCGVGYELLTPLGTAGRLTADAEGRVMVFVHTHLREDMLQLFGFASLDDRVAFRELLSVSKVGPKLALAVLGSLSVNELAQAVNAGSAAELAKVPGIGKKTAERLILELRGKLHPPAILSSAEALAPRAPAVGSNAALLHAALVKMGFRPSEAERAVATLGDRERPLAELVRDALGLLAP